MKKTNIELKIYELLGVKLFRKFILLNIDRFLKLIHINPCYMLTKLTYEDIQEQKDIAISCAYTHLFIMLAFFGYQIIFIPYLPYMLYTFILNGYCIIMQRYNIIKINQTLQKTKPYFEKKKDKVIKNIINEDNLLQKHQYKVIEHNKSQEINLNYLIANSTLEELKYYYNFIANINTNKTNQLPESFELTINKHKSLKLEFPQK